MEHPENSEEYKGLTVNAGIEQPSTINPYLKLRKKVRRREYTVDEFVDGISPVDFLDCQETIFTCDFELMNGERYYRFVIPTNKAVSRVEPELFEQYRDGVTISRIDIRNV